METPDGAVYTYGDLEGLSGAYARLLSGLGVAAGDRVAAQVEKSPQAVFLYLACMRLGAVYLPLNTAYRREEISYFLADAEPRVVVVAPERQAEVNRLIAGSRWGVRHVLTLAGSGDGSLAEQSGAAEPDYPTATSTADDLAALLYTSGTTGRSKGAMLTHGNLGSNALMLHRLWGWRPGDVMLHALPLFHTHGLFVAINCVLLNGSGMLFLPRFDAAEVIRLLPRATVFMGVPTFYTRLLDNPELTEEACRNMRLFTCGSAPLPEQTFEDFRQRTGYRILERYGMTETGMNTSNPLDGERIAGSVGLPLPDVQVRIADDEGHPAAQGEIGMLEVRGPNVFKGYWRMPEKTADEIRPDGFFITGDLARVDEKGYVSIVGRGKDLIISGGFNVYPKEVELAIDGLDGVDESAVIGIPHKDFGEAVTAVVKRLAGRGEVTEKAVIAALKEKMAAYKVPKEVHFVDELPRNSMGKVQKNQLREQFGDSQR